MIGVEANILRPVRVDVGEKKHLKQLSVERDMATKMNRHFEILMQSTVILPAAGLRNGGPHLRWLSRFVQVVIILQATLSAMDRRIAELHASAVSYYTVTKRGTELTTVALPAGVQSLRNIPPSPDWTFISYPVIYQARHHLPSKQAQTDGSREDWSRCRDLL